MWKIWWCECHGFVSANTKIADTLCQIPRLARKTVDINIGREKCNCKTVIIGLSPRKHDIPQPGLRTQGWLNFTTVTGNDTRIRTANENSLKRRQFECANLNRRRPTHQAATTGHHGTLYCDTCWFHVATRAPVLNVKIYGRYHRQLIVPSHTTHKSYEVNSTCRTPNYGTWHEHCSSAPCPRCSVLQTGRHVWAPTTLGVQTDGGGAGPVHFNYAWGTRNIMPKRSRINFSNRNMTKVHIGFCTSALKNWHHLSHLQASMSIITVDNDHQFRFSCLSTGCMCYQMFRMDRSE